jgi:hypothetical protein
VTPSRMRCSGRGGTSGACTTRIGSTPGLSPHGQCLLDQPGDAGGGRSRSRSRHLGADEPDHASDTGARRRRRRPAEPRAERAGDRRASLLRGLLAEIGMALGIPTDGRPASIGRSATCVAESSPGRRSRYGDARGRADERRSPARKPAPGDPHRPRHRPTADYADRLLERTATAAQRSAWRFPGAGSTCRPGGSVVAYRPRPVVLPALVALLVVALTMAAVFIGSVPRFPRRSGRRRRIACLRLGRRHLPESPTARYARSSAELLRLCPVLPRDGTRSRSSAGPMRPLRRAHGHRRPQRVLRRRDHAGATARDPVGRRLEPEWIAIADHDGARRGLPSFRRRPWGQPQRIDPHHVSFGSPIR